MISMTRCDSDGGHHLEGAGIDEIAHQHAGLVAEQRVGGVAAAAHGGMVDHVVVQQGGGVDELDEGRRPPGAGRRRARRRPRHGRRAARSAAAGACRRRRRCARRPGSTRGTLARQAGCGSRRPRRPGRPPPARGSRPAVIEPIRLPTPPRRMVPAVAGTMSSGCLSEGNGRIGFDRPRRRPLECAAFPHAPFRVPAFNGVQQCTPSSPQVASSIGSKRTACCKIEKLDAEPGSTVEFDEVLLVADGANITGRQAAAHGQQGQRHRRKPRPGREESHRQVPSPQALQARGQSSPAVHAGADHGHRA